MEIPMWEPMYLPQTWQRAKDGQDCGQWILSPNQEGYGHFLVFSVYQLRAITECGPLNGMELYKRQVSNELADIRESEKSIYPLLAGAFKVASLRNFLLRELMGGQTGKLVRKDNA